MNRVITAINALDPAPKAVIHTGDIAHNGTAEKYAVALDIFKQLRWPLYVVAGNRDDRDLIRTNFFSGRSLMPGSPFVQYVVDLYGFRLIGLDTLSDASNMGDFCCNRADSLRTALEEDAGRPCALFMHHPPFEVQESKFQWQFENMEAIHRLVSAIEGHTQVVAAFCGHAHRVSRGSLAGVPATTVPSVAIDVRLGKFPDAADASPVFYVHEFGSDNSFRTNLRIAA